MPNALNGLLGDPRGEMRATPRNKLMGLLADALTAANDYANKPDPAMPGGKANPVLGLLADGVSLNSLATTAQRASYGEPLTNAGKANTPFLKPETADALMMAPLSPRNALAALGMVGGMADNGAMRAATVWHGTPHKFDKFDASKIGTGEGAQAYGHGLYLAESPDVAKTYAPAVMEADVKENLLRMKQMLPSSQGVIRKNLEQAISEIEGGYSGGQLYKVDLPDEKIARMLDWDKPLSQQAPRLGLLSDSELYNLGITRNGADAFTGNPLTGADLMKFSDNQHGGGWLAKRGIPGLRYLDGGSRGVGQGTSNFVVFPGEENALRILERNGNPVR